VSWYGRDDNPYPGGTEFDCIGAAEPAFDLNFRTFVPNDTQPPDTQVAASSKAGSVSRSASVRLQFKGTDDLSYASRLQFACSLDGAKATVCTSPIAYEGLKDGRHVFMVVAIDEAGSRDPTPAVATWTTDRNPPTAPTVTGPRVVRGATAVYRFSARDEATSSASLRYRCALDLATLRRCNTTFTAHHLTRGVHILRAVAVDLGGNTGPAAILHIQVLA
jgi:hypothetical protein